MLDTVKDAPVNVGAHNHEQAAVCCASAADAHRSAAASCHCGDAASATAHAKVAADHCTKAQDFAKQAMTGSASV
ncbi:MAG: hypothetical protein KBA75_03170 [Alphaproteobacteria bacterium]|nr:hypothetical protein [Alphaproteobacteria bacterium]